MDEEDISQSKKNVEIVDNLDDLKTIISKEFAKALSFMIRLTQSMLTIQQNRDLSGALHQQAFLITSMYFTMIFNILIFD